MDKIPSNIKNIVCGLATVSLSDCNGDRVYFECNLNVGKPDETKLRIFIPYDHNHINCNEIVEENPEFVNGFKLVRVLNGKFGYIRQSDGVFLPYRFDIATNFNEYGLAMVEKDHFATWLNKDFELLDSCGLFREIPTQEKYKEFQEKYAGTDLYMPNPDKYKGYYGDNFAWEKVYDFSEGTTPLARVQDSFGKTAYLGIDGELKVFREYDGTLKKQEYTLFADGTDFDKNGCATCKDSMLFADGFFIKYANLKKLFASEGFIQVLNKEVRTQIESEKKTKPKKLLNIPEQNSTN